jgi:NTE family protein
LVNPVPVSVCRALGARYVIAVNLNSDLAGRDVVVVETGRNEEHAEPEEPAAEPTGPARNLLRRQLLGDGLNAPGISTVMVDAFNIVQDRIARSRLAGDPPDAIISPRLAGIGMFDFHRADELILRGMSAALREIEDVHREIEARRAARLRLPHYA